MDAALEALYAVEPEMVEPSYARAFEFIAANSKRPIAGGAFDGPGG